ncbi:hypothetical protein GCM10027610_144060 [Dactylosporangium cerinum]
MYQSNLLWHTSTMTEERRREAEWHLARAAAKWRRVFHRRREIPKHVA